MKQNSVLSDAWCNLVFEGRNQNYGAFQLRRRSEKTTLLALIFSVLIVVSGLSIPLILSKFDAPDKLLIHPVIWITPGLDKIRPVVPVLKEQQPPKSEKSVKKEILPVISEQKDKNGSSERKNDDLIKNDITAFDSLLTDNGIIGDRPADTLMVDNTVHSPAGIEEMPMFPGGEGAMFSFFKDKVRH